MLWFGGAVVNGIHLDSCGHQRFSHWNVNSQCSVSTKGVTSPSTWNQKCIGTAKNTWFILRLPISNMARNNFFLTWPHWKWFTYIIHRELDELLTGHYFSPNWPLLGSLMLIAVQLTYNVGFVTQPRTFDLYNSVTGLSPCVLLGKKTKQATVATGYKDTNLCKIVGHLKIV